MLNFKLFKKLIYKHILPFYFFRKYWYLHIQNDGQTEDANQNKLQKS